MPIDRTNVSNNTPCCQLLLVVAGNFASAEATKGLFARPLETFGAATFGVIRS
jgi:hypothetical protein